ncbi:MAG: AMP-binding protein [Oscillospiraceae bacterium]|nr:AMP-binding protein [Oscillospiraceae bacterium]
METTTKETNEKIMDVALRIWELRELSGYTKDEMAERLGITAEAYAGYESGSEDLPFSFIHNCALLFGVELGDLLEGESARLTSYSVVRRGKGRVTSSEHDSVVRDLAPRFKNKNAEPYWVTYSYSEEQQSKPIQLVSHSGQEFDLIFSGRLKIQIGEHTELLAEGDSIYYNSSTPHGMIAVGGSDCVFCAVVMPGEDEGAEQEAQEAEAIIAPAAAKRSFVYENFALTDEDEHGALQAIAFKDQDKFNFAFDVVDALAAKSPGKLAMLHVDREQTVRRFSFEDISRQSSRAANYFSSLGIKRGDRVMLVLKRNWQFWPIIVALHKIGAVAIPATDQLLQKDFEYRFEAAGVSAIVCTAQSGAPAEVESAMESCPGVAVRVIVNGEREGWSNYDRDVEVFRSAYPRADDAPCGEDLMLMYFSSGTTGYPKIAAHSYTYALGHFIGAKYWHNVDPDGIHFTISDTGWGKSVWGKLYGQWLCEAAVFTYDFDRFDPLEILPMFAKHGITTFCAPPTMYRFLIREDLSKYDLSTIKHLTTAGEALNPEVFHQFKKATGLSIMEGFGQTETTLSIGNFIGMTPKVGAMGKPSPLYKVALMDAEGNMAGPGEVGEIVILTDDGAPCGLFKEYYRDEEKTLAAWHDGAYHTGDTAWQDEEGYLWYVGRVDDLIKSSGYRIGPFEIESVIMELPYVLECGVSPEPDEIRGQVVKASVVLTKDKEPSEELKKEIQEYVKTHTAPYKYPRIVVFRDSLPRTFNGKVQRNRL